MSAQKQDSNLPAKEFLSALAGYNELPAVHDSLPIILPPFPQVTHRYVAIDNEIWELWSPNATYHAYYPGIKKIAQDFESSGDDKVPRSNGHLGRFDATRNPQLYNPRKPWLPFVRKAAKPASKYPEFTPFFDAWDGKRERLFPEVVEDYKLRLKAIQDAAGYCEDQAETLGPIRVDKPLVPSMEDLTTLLQSREPETVFHKYVALQRAIKEVAAWSCFVKARVAEASNEENDLTKVQPAYDQAYMGLWLNGCSAYDIQWYLRARVPCFIIHTVESFSDRHYYEEGTLAHRSFSSNTEVMEHLEYGARVDEWFRQRGWKMISRSCDPDIARYEPDSTWEERVRTSPRGQGWVNGGRRSSPPYNPTPCAELGGWMIPPKLVPASNRSGSWEHWYEAVDEDMEPVMVKGGPGQLKNGKWVDYYDREQRRFIHLKAISIPSRRYLADEAIYGTHAPDVPWITKLEGRDARRVEHNRSLWMYKSQVPSKEELKRAVYNLPTDRNALLPHIRNLRSYDSDEDSEEGEYTTPPSNPNASTSRSRQESPLDRRSPTPEVTRQSRRSSTYDSEAMDTREDRSSYAPRREERQRSYDERHSPDRSQSVVENRQSSRDKRRRSSSSPPRESARRSPSRDRYDYRGHEHRTRRNEEPIRPQRPARGHSYYRGARAYGDRQPRYEGSHWSPSRSRSPPRRRFHSPPRATASHSYRQRGSESSRNSSSSYARSVESQSYSPQPSSSRARSPPREPAPSQPSYSRQRSPVRNVVSSGPPRVSATDERPSSATSSQPVPKGPKATTIPTDSLSRELPILHGPNVDYSVIHTDSFFNMNPRIPTLQAVGDESRFLAIANIPPNFKWTDVLRYMRLLIPPSGRQGIQRVVRSVEDGEQIFWVSCSSRTVAGLARGRLHTRKAPGLPPFVVEFVPEKAFSARNSWMPLRWTRDKGLTTRDKGLPMGKAKTGTDEKTPKVSLPKSQPARSTKKAVEIDPLDAPDAHFLETEDPNDRQLIAKVTEAIPLEQRLSDPPPIKSPIEKKKEWRPSLYKRLGSRPNEFLPPTRRPRRHLRADKKERNMTDRAPSPTIEDYQENTL